MEGTIKNMHKWYITSYLDTAIYNERESGLQIAFEWCYTQVIKLQNCSKWVMALKIWAMGIFNVSMLYGDSQIEHRPPFGACLLTMIWCISISHAIILCTSFRFSDLCSKHLADRFVSLCGYEEAEVTRTFYWF